MLFEESLKQIPVSHRIYLDESGMNDYVHREYGRGLRGKEVPGEISGKRFARQSVISAGCKGKLFAPMCFEGTGDARLFNTWLKERLIPNLMLGQVLILDHGRFHRSIESQKRVDAAGCHMLFLRLYSFKILGKYEKKVRE